MFYDTKLDCVQTDSQLARRGLLHPSVDLAAIGIYPLDDRPPADYDPTVQTIASDGAVPVDDNDTAQGYRVDWRVDYMHDEVVRHVLLEKLAEVRWRKEVGGIDWNGHRVDTDSVSQAKIMSEHLAVTSGIRQDGNRWKMANGRFIPLTNVEVQDLAVAVHAHVSGCFDREAEISEALSGLDASTAHQVFLDNVGIGWPGTDPE